MAESVFGTLRRVVGQRREMGVTPYPSVAERPIDKPLFDYFFKVQSAIEKEGRMDYHRYAARLWQELVVGSAEQPVDLAANYQFKRFEGNLILGLHNIDMRQHIYDDLVDNIGYLVAKFGESVRKVVIWTTGDNKATGYQPAKIARSRVISAFTNAVRVHYEGDPASSGDFISSKTGAIISDNKFVALTIYLESDNLTKLVVIEDSRGNLRRVANMVTVANEAKPEGKRIDFIPIWATYSREGMQAKEKAEREGKLGELEQEKAQLHAIDSPSDLLGNRFRGIFDAADILVDFDGVIGNNLTMRDAQARVKYNALIGAIMDQKGVDSDWASSTILENLVRLPAVA